MRSSMKWVGNAGKETEVAEATWLLRIEGVNFDATVFDTNDISTVRGAGLALLEAAADVALSLAKAPGVTLRTRVFAGASQAAFIVEGPEDAARQAARAAVAVPVQDGAPHDHLIYMIDIALLDDPDDPVKVQAAVDIAEARTRARQFRSFTVALPNPTAPATLPDPYDATRQALVPVPDPDNPAATVLMSASVWARREYGRKMRAGFYASGPAAPGGAGLLVTDSFEQIVDNAPRVLPEAVKGKLAYLYADGNGFGRIRREAGAAAFAREIDKYQGELLDRLIGWLREGLTAHDPLRTVIDARGQERIRFETLLWGGDDMLFVMPAWLGLHMLGEFSAATSGWQIDGEALTYSFGLAICGLHTPVRLARHTAKELAESVKAALQDPPVNAASIQVFESQSPLDTSLLELRCGLFGVPNRQPEADSLNAALTIHGHALPGLAATLRDLTDGSVREGKLAPSVLHAAIAAARSSGSGLLSPAAATAADRVLDAAFRRFGRSVEIDIPGLRSRGLVGDLCLVAMLRDYCRLPPETALPPFPRPASAPAGP